MAERSGTTEAAGCRGGGRPKGTSKRRPRPAAIEARRALVARGLLAGKTVRAIAAELAERPPGERPPQCSKSAIGRDALRLRAEWAQARAAALEARLAEDWARLAALEQVWWPRAMEGEAVATDKYLAVQRQRVGLLAAGTGRVAVEAGTAGPGGAQAMRVTVEFVEDWRGVREE